MINDNVIAIDLSNIYASLGGEKPDHKPSDKKDVLIQAKAIIDDAGMVFTFIVFSAEFSNDMEFLAVKDKLFTVKIAPDKQYILTPKSLETDKVFKDTIMKYGSTIQKEVNTYIENAKIYYKLNSGGNAKLASGIRVINPPGSKPLNEPEGPQGPGSDMGSTPGLQGLNY